MPLPGQRKLETTAPPPSSFKDAAATFFLPPLFSFLSSFPGLIYQSHLGDGEDIDFFSDGTAAAADEALKPSNKTRKGIFFINFVPSPFTRREGFLVHRHHHHRLGPPLLLSLIGSCCFTAAPVKIAVEKAG